MDSVTDIAAVFNDVILPGALAELKAQARDPVVFATFWSLARVNRCAAAIIARDCEAICTAAVVRHQEQAGYRIGCISQLLPNGRPFGRQIANKDTACTSYLLSRPQYERVEAIYTVTNAGRYGTVELLTITKTDTYLFVDKQFHDIEISMITSRRTDVDMLLRANLPELARHSAKFTIEAHNKAIRIVSHAGHHIIHYINGRTSICYVRRNQVRSLLALVTDRDIPDALFGEDYIRIDVRQCA
jgi:hypothetical protein